MSAELIIGAVSLATVVSTVKDCFKAYHALSRSSPDKELRRFNLQIRLEDRRFRVFWEYLGLDEARLQCPLFEEQAASTQTLILNIAQQIASLLREVTNLSEGHKFEPRTPGEAGVTSITESVSAVISSLGHTTTDSPPQDGQSSPSRLSLRKKLKWLGDHNEAKEIISQLHSFNDALWNCLPRRHQFLLGYGAGALGAAELHNGVRINELLLSRDTIHDRPRLNWTSVLEFSILMRGAIELNADPAVQPTPVHEDDFKLLASPAPKTCLGTPRQVALWHSPSGEIPAIIESEGLGHLINEEGRLEVKHRCQNLIYLLSQRSRTEFCLAQGIGIFEDSKDSTRQTICMAFRLPFQSAPATVSSLADLLAKGRLTGRNHQPNPSLGDRFKLVSALAESLMLFHSAGWLHKGFQPENILFQTSDTRAPPDISRPFIMGFDMSRPNSNEETSYNAEPTDDSFNPFLHPDRARRSTIPYRYRTKYDYYSLGMCLICIALWEDFHNMAQHFRKKHREDPSLITHRNWAQYVSEKAGTLGPRCGDMMRGVIDLCLNWEERRQELPRDARGPNLDELKTFFLHVVKPLASCHA